MTSRLLPGWHLSWNVSGVGRGVALSANTLHNSQLYKWCPLLYWHDPSGQDSAQEPPVLSPCAACTVCQDDCPLEPKQWSTPSLLMGYPDLCYVSVSIKWDLYLEMKRCVALLARASLNTGSQTSQTRHHPVCVGINTHFKSLLSGLRHKGGGTEEVDLCSSQGLWSKITFDNILNQGMHFCVYLGPHKNLISLRIHFCFLCLATFTS